MKDALDAPQGLLTPCGDAVKGFVVVLQGSAALAAGRGEKKNHRDPLPLLCPGIGSQIYWHAWHCRVRAYNPRVREADARGWQIKKPQLHRRVHLRK